MGGLDNFPAAYAAYAQAGSIVMTVLALLHALVWRVQRARWSALMSLACGLAAVVYGFDAVLQPGEARGHPVGSTLGAIGLVATTLAIADYVQLPAGALRWVWRVAIGAGVVLLGLRLVGLLPRIAGSLSYAGYFVAQAAMVGWALWRQPQHGHGLVLAALALYPAVLLAVLSGAFDVKAMRYLVIVPVTVLGVTMLATGLLRAERHSRDELQRRRGAEDALRALNESLEQRVAQRTRELHEVVAGLESFNRSVSHDLRGPLGGIAGVARLATEALARGDLVAVQRLLSAVVVQADASSQLVAALLALARVGQTELAPQPIDLNRFVRETLAQLDLADPAAAAVPVQVGPLPAVAADPALLRQVLVNLLGNARKFARQAQQPQVEVGSEPGAVGGAPVFYVRDNGVGFAADQAAGLFEPFRRLHGGQFAGHGIGLSIVKRIIERHGGRVWAEGRPGEGATFRFTLGTANANAAATAGAGSATLH